MKAKVKAASIVALFFLIAAAANAVTVEEITIELVCQCGCALVLENCNHSDCGSALPMTELVGEKVAAGESKEEILSFFVSQYGEAVLAAPTKRGFNLTVWLLPFFSILAGAGVVSLLILSWVRRRASLVLTNRTQKPGYVPADDEETERIFREELKDFE